MRRAQKALQIVMAACLAMALQGAARAQSPAFRVFTDADGVPQSSVNALVFDAAGRLWIGTMGGAAWYDGQRFRAMPLPIEQAQPAVMALAASPDGGMWLGTLGRGVWRYKSGTWTRFGVQEGLPDEVVWSLASAGDITWAGTEHGLGRFAAGRWERIGAEGQPVGTITAFALPQPASPAMWLGTTGGLVRIEDGTWKVFQEQSSPLPGNRVRAVLERTGDTGSSEVWTGTQAGLAALTGGAWSIYHKRHGGIPDDNVRAIAETRNASGRRTLWIGTRSGGLAGLSQGTWTTYDRNNSGLWNNDVVSLLASGDGNTLWIGTNGGGVGRMYLGPWSFFSSRNAPFDGFVTAVAETTGRTGSSYTWLGTSSGLLKWDGAQWTKYAALNSGLPSNSVLDVRPVKNGSGPESLWVGTDAGLARLDDGKWTSYPIPGNRRVQQVLESVGEPGVVWAGTASGLVRLQGSEATVLRKEDGTIPGNGVRRLLETRSTSGETTLWIGTVTGGIGRLQRGRWTTFDTKNSPLASEDVLALAEVTVSGQRELWVGVAGGGLSRIPLDVADATWKRLSTSSKPALPHDGVVHILQDAPGDIWVSTERGIARLAPRKPTSDDPAEFSIRTYSAEDGLPSNESAMGTSLIDHRGRLWLPMAEGVAIFDPSVDAGGSAPGALLLRDARVSQRLQPLQAGERLPHDQNALAFEYALLSFHRESEIRYRTQLAGIEPRPSEWTADTRSQYASLPPGSYTFQVWAKDYAGNIAGPATIAFRVAPAPWRTVWAYAGYVLVGLAAVYGVFRWRIRALELQRRRLEEKVKQRTRELDAKVEELAQRSRELSQRNDELRESHQRADWIFSALSDALCGRVLDDRYRLDEQIGQGGFATVFKGFHLTLERPVAVKVFRPEPGNDSAESLERFRREGMTACRVHHPNAIQVFDSGITTEGIAYLVMELLKGRSLEAELRGRKIVSLRRCEEIITPTCAALAVAHAAGLVHRDIKPANIFLHEGEQGEVVKVVDFGIAKVLGKSGSADLTSTGQPIGTPAYMAPERLLVGTCDASADIFSLGVVMYRMVTGRRPFDGTMNEILLRIMQSSPAPPETLNPGIPAEVSAIIMLALSKDPAARPTAEELARGLAAAVDRMSMSQRLHVPSLPHDEGPHSEDTLADSATAPAARGS
jgi:ligand-binding sensor domain-containing protein